MGPRAALILAGLSAIALCGCAADNASGQPTQDLGIFPGTDLSFPVNDAAFCEPRISITASPGPDIMGGQLFAPQDLIATSESITANAPPMWTVQLADGTVVLPTVTDPASGLTVRLHAPVPGSYTFRTQFVDGCRGMNSVDVFSRSSKSVAWRLRISPPSSASVPQQDQIITVNGGTPVGDKDLLLVAGTTVQSTLRGPGAAAIAGEVRLIADDGAPDALGTAGTNGIFAVAVNPNLKYTPLVIPAGSTLSPVLISPSTLGALLSTVTFATDAGVAVGGTLTDLNNAPIAGARVVLRAGKLPSGTGVSAVDGTWSLRAQAGSYVASIGADGWPEVTLPSVTAPATLDLKYLVARTPINVKVVASNGTPVAGARVTLRSPLLAAVANASVGGLASGRMKVVAVSGADGTLPALMLPSATYDILVEPPAGAADGMTALQQSTTSATWTLALQPKIALAGTVTNLLGQPVGDVKVTAFETAGLGAAPSAISSSDGTYSVRVDPGSPVELLFEPPGVANLSSARIGLGAGATHADAALGPGLRVGGFIVAPGGSKLASVVVDVLCATCGSAAPITSAISDGTGAYALYFPDPGVVDTDGGVIDGGP